MKSEIREYRRAKRKQFHIKKERAGWTQEPADLGKENKLSTHVLFKYFPCSFRISYFRFY